VSVGGDHFLANACASAAGPAPRLTARLAAEQPPRAASDGRGTESRSKDAQPSQEVVEELGTVPRARESTSRELSDYDANGPDQGALTAPGPRSAAHDSSPAAAADTAQEAVRADDPGFRDFVASRSRAMLRTAYLLTGNRADAEDLVQAALAKTYLAWDRIADRNALDGYVRRAIVNTHISWWRRRRVEEYPTDAIPDQAVADHAVDSDLQESLRRAIDRLPQRMRTAVVLRYYEDMTEAEMADILGVTLGTVKSTVSRAVAKLRADADLQAD
jgi:RNA polymerase sigma-70 factor (sigma-E family)